MNRDLADLLKRAARNHTLLLWWIAIMVTASLVMTIRHWS